jgi:hypothetical protein
LYDRSYCYDLKYRGGGNQENSLFGNAGSTKSSPQARENIIASNIMDRYRDQFSDALDRMIKKMTQLSRRVQRLSKIEVPQPQDSFSTTALQLLRVCENMAAYHSGVAYESTQQHGSGN